MRLYLSLTLRPTNTPLQESHSWCPSSHPCPNFRVTSGEDQVNPKDFESPSPILRYDRGRANSLSVTDV